MKKNNSSVAAKSEQNDEPSDEVLELELEDLTADFGDFRFQCTKEVSPRSFASLQLRAANAVKTLFRTSDRLLLLCGSGAVDLIGTACDLVRENVGLNPTVAYAPTKFEMFGDDKTDGILTEGGCVVMPCSHLIDHPKRLGMLDACLNLNHKLKLILCGDATDCAQLLMMWPQLENALHADIVTEFSSSGALRLIAGLIASYRVKGEVRDFDFAAVELLCYYGCRVSGDRRWLGIPEIKLKQVIKEADLYAGASQLITVRNVLKAIGADDFRANYLAEAELRDHRDRQILMSTQGQVVGQINGLSVIETSGTSYVYGEPVRITATLRAGGEGDVIDIERKAELAGQIHAKAMMIINGFLTKEFGSQQPLPVSASLVFEQSYSEIDGDSASLTGLCAVISCLAEAPIRQDLAVTGAVDQFGDVQSVGGVNEKIEGFFKICRLHGLTGTQGVIIPKSCVHQLMLRPSVIRAIKEGRFHIYTVSHVTGATKLLLSLPWGEPEVQDSVCGMISDHLDELLNHELKPWWHFW